MILVNKDQLPESKGSFIVKSSNCMSILNGFIQRRFSTDFLRMFVDITEDNVQILKNIRSQFEKEKELGKTCFFFEVESVKGNGFKITAFFVKKQHVKYLNKNTSGMRSDSVEFK